MLEVEAALPPETRHRALTERIRAFIQQNLHDPELTPPAIAAAHHISLSYLHRLFQEEVRGETVAAWIRSRRLEGARRDLADPALRATPIHAIATRWGLPAAPDSPASSARRTGSRPRSTGSRRWLYGSRRNVKYLWTHGQRQPQRSPGILVMHGDPTSVLHPNRGGMEHPGASATCHTSVGYPACSTNRAAVSASTSRPSRAHNPSLNSSTSMGPV